MNLYQNMTHLSISLLGPLQITLDNEPVVDFATDKARALLAYLAVESGYAHRRDVLAGLLWPDQPQDKARQSLRQALRHVRQAIADDEAATPYLLVSRETIQFIPESDAWLDVAAFTALLEKSRTHRHRRRETCLPCIGRLEDMLHLYRGDFLAHFFLGDAGGFEEWALLKREWLRREAVEALYHLADYYERRGDYGRAENYARRVVALEPWREEAHRQLMRLLARGDQRSAALAQYEACRRALDGELAVEPSGETVALYERIRDGGDSAPSLAAPPALPVAPTPFVGRRQELGELAETLAHPERRLVTLVGPGGVGKTRLALQAAAEQIGAFPHGVHFVPLAPLPSADLLAAAIAHALNLPLLGAQDPAEQLLNYLRAKELLLVLDNLEHLPEAGSLLADILRQAPGVVLLATSRQSLQLREEWVYQVEGLAYPRNQAAQDLAGYEAVDLFVQSARRVQRRFSLTADEAPHVFRICRLVEGLPLGVELAAAGLSERDCASIAGQIERNLDALATSLRNVPGRHRSLRATFEHSWTMLSEDERRVFSRLSVFHGGFRAEAAGHVADAPASILSTLQNKSLLRGDPSGRYQMHELLRQFAAEKLNEVPEERETTRFRHGCYYAAFLARREGALKGEGQGAALAEIGAEIDNVRHAWRRALGQLESGPHQAQAMSVLNDSAESLYLFYVIRDWYGEGEEAFEAAAAAVGNLDASGRGTAREKELLWARLLARQGKCCEFTTHLDRAQGLFERSLGLCQRLEAWSETGLPLHGLGYVAHMRGDYERAARYFQDSLAVYRRCQDAWGVANVLNNLCLVNRRRGAFRDAERRSQESLAIRRAIGDLRGVVSSLNNLGLVYCDLGDYAYARQALEEALELCRQLGHRVGKANALTGLCQASFRLGDTGAAEAFGQESLAVYRDIGDYWGVAIALNNLGRMAAELGDYARARDLYQEAVAFFHRIGVQSGLANTLSNLAEACYEQGEYVEAQAYLRQALGIAYEIGALPAVLKGLVVLARLLAHQGQAGRSLELLAFCLRQPSIARDIRAQAAALFADLARDRSQTDLAAAEAWAGARSLDEVVADVL